MKKLTSLLLTLVLMLPTAAVFARDLSLEEALTLGAKNSNQLKIYEKESIASSIAVSEARSNRTLVGAGDTSLNAELTRSGFYVTQARSNQTIAEKAEEDYREQLKLKIKTDYFTYKAAKDRQEKAFLAYSYANENLWVVHSKYLVGLASQLEDTQAAVNKLRANDEREAAARAADLARRQLCATIGLPMDTDIEVIDQLVLPETSLEPITDEIVKKAVDNSMSVIQARVAQDLAYEKFDVIEDSFGSGSYTYRSADVACDSSKEKRILAETNAKLNTYKLYYDALNAFESAQTAAQAVAQAEQAYIIAVVRYDAGLIPNSDVISSFANFKDAQIAENQAKLAAVTTLANYEMAIGEIK